MTPGTRVAVYWSSKYHFLHPGTLVAPEQGSAPARPRYVQVELDDGDSR